MTWGTNLPKPIWRETPGDPFSPSDDDIYCGEELWNASSERIVAPDKRSKPLTSTWIVGGLIALALVVWLVSTWVSQERRSVVLATPVPGQTAVMQLQPSPNPRPQPTPILTPVLVLTTYEVKLGDTLWDIAQHFYGDGTKWRVISETNHIDNPKNLKVGTTLIIPHYER